MTTKKPLELTWYTCRECGDSRCFMDDEIPDKRLGNDELAVEWNRSAAITAIHGLHADGNRTATLHRFLNAPHAFEMD